MRLLWIIDPLDKLQVHKDSTIALMQAAQNNGHSNLVACGQDLRIESDATCVHVRARARLLVCLDAAKSAGSRWYTLDSAQDYDLPTLDAVFMRIDPPVDSEYVYMTYLLEIAERNGARVWNAPQALRDYNEKLAILRHNRWIAPTCVTRSIAEIRAFMRCYGEVILKPLDGMGGNEIFRLNEKDPNVSVALEMMTQQGTRTVMVQRYIPEILDGDKRVILIDGVPVPYCLARIPQSGETRGNLAAGGRGVARPLSPQDRDIAKTLGPSLAAAGLLLVGLDIIGNFLTEINVTSPTCLVEIAAQTDCNPAALFVQAIEQKVRSSERGSADRA